MLGVCAVLIQLLLRVGSDRQVRASATGALARLAQQIRQDAHACDDARLDKQPGGKPANLYFARGPKQRISYEIRSAGIQRIEGDADGGSIFRRELYRVPGASGARFELRTEGPLHLAVLVLSPLSGARALEPPGSLEVVAVMGTDHAGPLAERGTEGR
jgi:hypothetical protein